jgi:outer membrane receptor protein involved in Fe transport
MVPVVCLLWLMAGEASAQGARRLEGRLMRPDGKALAGVTVTVGGTRTSTLTDGEGRFVLAPVPTGTFPVIISLGRHVLSVDVHFDGPQGTLDRTLDWDVPFGETVTVSAASRQTERLFDAPASVAIVDEAAIGLEAPQAQVPRLLASVPGLELTQSGIFDFNLNIRGLNAALTRRVLTLIDGRDAASVLIGAQEWAAFGLPLDELSRIEIVRGPGAALYGANAFNGVIDITTKPPKATQGGQAEVAFGELGTRRLSARYAGTLGARTSYRIHGAYGRADDWYESRNVTAEYPGLPREVQGLQRDHTVFSHTGARVDVAWSDARSLTLEGGWAYTDGNVFLTGAGRIQNTGAHRPWVRAALATRSWRTSLYYDGRYGEMASLSAGSTIVDRSEKVNAETQRLFSLASGTRIVVGAYRFLHAMRDSVASHPSPRCPSGPGINLWADRHPL